MSVGNIFAVIIPQEADFSAIIAPTTEMSKLYVMAAKKAEQLSEQTRIERDEDGNILAIIDHPDLKWWFEECRRLASDIAKLTANLQLKETENKIDTMNIFMQAIPQEWREKFAMDMLKKKGVITHETD